MGGGPSLLQWEVIRQVVGSRKALFSVSEISRVLLWGLCRSSAVLGTSEDHLLRAAADCALHQAPSHQAHVALLQTQMRY